MTEITITGGTLRKDSVGNLIEVSADVTSVGNNETWTVPHLRKITAWGFAPTTDDSAGGTVSGNVITIKNGTDQAGKIWARGQ